MFRRTFFYGVRSGTIWAETCRRVANLTLSQSSVSQGSNVNTNIIKIPKDLIPNERWLCLAVWLLNCTKSTNKDILLIVPSQDSTRDDKYDLLR